MTARPATSTKATRPNTFRIDLPHGEAAVSHRLGRRVFTDARDFLSAACVEAIGGAPVRASLYRDGEHVGVVEVAADDDAFRINTLWPTESAGAVICGSPVLGRVVVL